MAVLLSSPRQRKLRPNERRVVLEADARLGVMWDSELRIIRISPVSPLQNFTGEIDVGDQLRWVNRYHVRNMEELKARARARGSAL